MDPFLSDEQAILHQAADRARRLLEHLVQDRREMEAFGGGYVPTDLPDDPGFPSPGLLAEGEALLRRASDSARRLSDDLHAMTDPRNAAGAQPSA